MRRNLVGFVLSIRLAVSANGQAALGTYTMTPPGGRPITLVLQKDREGKITGSLGGNGTSYAVQGELQGDDVSGTMSGGGLKSFFEAHRDGANLRMIVADVGPDGKPDYVHARELLMTPTGAASTTTVAQLASSGNPLAGGGSPAGDKFAGTFASADVTLSLNKDGAGYAGTVRYRGADYPATATPAGETLTGSFKAGAQSFPMTIASAGDGKFVNLTTGGTTFMLARASAAANPLTAGAGAAVSTSLLAKTPQDQQIAKLLISTAWCSFSFSGSSTYTGGSSGTTRTSRAVFRADGTASEGSNAETTNSGSAGSAYGRSGNGQQGKWRIENGLLMLSADGVQWTPTQLKIADNGSGSPILTAGGKEYMVCR